VCVGCMRRSRPGVPCAACRVAGRGIPVSVTGSGVPCAAYRVSWRGIPVIVTCSGVPCAAYRVAWRGTLPDKAHRRSVPCHGVPAVQSCSNCAVMNGIMFQASPAIASGHSQQRSTRSTPRTGHESGWRRRLSCLPSCRFWLPHLLRSLVAVTT
jgi:hypothetical protein